MKRWRLLDMPLKMYIEKRDFYTQKNSEEIVAVYKLRIQKTFLNQIFNCQQFVIGGGYLWSI